MYPRSVSCAPNTTERHLQVVTFQGVTIVYFLCTRFVEEPLIQRVSGQLSRLIEEPGREKVVVNFNNIECLSAAALGKMVTLRKLVLSLGKRLVLCSPKPFLEEIFFITRLNSVFTLVSSEQEAITLLGSDSPATT